MVEKFQGQQQSLIESVSEFAIMVYVIDIP